MTNIYWVISRDCNQHCGHCYNNSEPGAPGLTFDEVDKVVENMPDPDRVPLARIGVSGGEILHWPDLAFHALKALKAKYHGKGPVIAAQSNGDYMDEKYLDMLLEHGVTRVAISSQDRYHLPQTRERRPYLESLFDSRGFETVVFTGNGPPVAKDPTKPQVSFWGANDDLWIGPLWPRGRAEKNGLSRATTKDEFCMHGSGAKNFLNYMAKDQCSVNIQLSDVYPCCPMTCRPIGDLLQDSLIDILDRCAKHPVYRALNEGVPEKMGEYMGLSEEFGRQRSAELGNHCLWCDEFFTKHAPELLHHGSRTERGGVDLTIRGARLGRKAAERLAAEASVTA